MSFSSEIATSSENLGVLSSGWTETTGHGKHEETVEYDTIFSVIFDFLGDAGSWAEAVAKLIGLVA